MGADHLRRATQLLAKLNDADASTCIHTLHEMFSAAANGAHISLYGRARGKRVRLPAIAAWSTERFRSLLPPAAVFHVRNRTGAALLEVHIEQADIDYFTQV